MFSPLRSNNSEPTIKKWMLLLGIGFKHQPLSELTRFEKMKLELLRAIAGEARIILLSQVFMSCSDEETCELALIVKQLNQHGIAVILDVEHYHEFEDSISRCIVLRNGMVAATLYKDENDIFNEDSIRHAVIGRSFDQRDLTASIKHEKDEQPLLKLVRRRDGRSIDFYRGSRVGLYDAEETLSRTVDGLIEALNGEMELYIEGERFLPQSVDDLIGSGVAVISAEAAERPIFYNLSPVENVTILAQQRFGQRFIYKRRVSRYMFDLVVSRYGFLRHCVTLREREDCYNLPYERQYELMIAKWLAINPRILLVYLPLNNTDTKNQERFRNLQTKLGLDGKIIIAISSNLDSIEGLCDDMHEL